MEISYKHNNPDTIFSNTHHPISWSGNKWISVSELQGINNSQNFTINMTKQIINNKLRLKNKLNCLLDNNK